MQNSNSSPILFMSSNLMKNVLQFLCPRSVLAEPVAYTRLQYLDKFLLCGRRNIQNLKLKNVLNVAVCSYPNKFMI